MTAANNHRPPPLAISVVVPVRNEADSIGLLLELLLAQTLRPDEVQQAFQRFRERHAETSAADTRRSGKIVSLVGGKSGVGTSTVAASLAAALRANSPRPQSPGARW